MIYSSLTVKAFLVLVYRLFFLLNIILTIAHFKLSYNLNLVLKIIIKVNLVAKSNTILVFFFRIFF